MKNYQITEWCARFIREHVKEGDVCIDATAGNGNDTLLLCELAGKTGKVFAFDIQEQAVKRTKERVEECGYKNVRVLLESHVRMGDYVQEEEASCIVFNFGYLPGGDHTLSTKKESSIEAVRKGLSLLKKGGLMSLCIYSGGDSGFEERDAILDYVQTLDAKRYLVIVTAYFNRPNHPPLPVMILKL